jgi:hypothetical protein
VIQKNNPSCWSKLIGKNILLVAPIFFGYEIDIANELRSQGAHVDYLPDRPFHSSFMKALTRLHRNLIFPFADNFYYESVRNFNRDSYDIVFVIQGEGLSPAVLSMLRTQFPRAKFIWYLWDSIQNKRSLENNFNAFDECYSFDDVDCKNYNINYRPLFYSKGFKKSINDAPKYKLSFIGTAHSDRFKIVSNLASAISSDEAFYRYLYLQAPWVYWINKIGNKSFKDASIKEFYFKPLPKKEVQNIFFESLAVLDIEHPRQRGLTMRTFEAMGAEKKIITTNGNVRDTDFYNPNNILIIERKKCPSIPDSFLNTPYVPLSGDISENYSLASWVKQIFYNS